MSKYFRFFLIKKKGFNGFRIFSHIQEKKNFLILFVQKLTFFVIKLPKMSLKGICHTHPQPKTH